MCNLEAVLMYISLICLMCVMTNVHATHNSRKGL